MEYKEALQRAAALCSNQERNTQYIARKLSEWEIPPVNAEKIIRKLKEEKFLDDMRYASFFVKDKFRFNRWGKIKIGYALRQKGIPEGAIDEALSQIDDEDYLQTCRELIRQKSASLKETNPYTRKAKLVRFASQRGFESELIYRILQTGE
jgi:regulatory protein